MATFKNIKELLFGKPKKKTINELTSAEKREQLINEYHKLTNEIKHLENAIFFLKEDQADALQDGINMYSKLRLSVYKQICDMDGKYISETKIVYFKDKINIFRNGELILS